MALVALLGSHLGNDARLTRETMKSTVCENCTLSSLLLQTTQRTNPKDEDRTVGVIKLRQGKGSLLLHATTGANKNRNPNVKFIQGVQDIKC